MGNVGEETKSKRKRAERHQAKVKAENQEAQIFDRETRNRQQITIVDPNGVPLDAGHTVEGAIQKAITFKKLLQQAKRQYLFTFFPSKYSNFSWAIKRCCSGAGPRERQFLQLFQL